MNKIVVFGTKDQLTIIRERLSVSYEVIGCYDLTDDCNGKICSINDIQDNICIFADKKQKRKFNDIFGEIGVESVIFEDFVHTTYTTPIDNIQNHEFTGLIMGMSHSQCAIDVSKISKYKYLNIAAPSMDLYLQRGFLLLILEKYPNFIQNIKSIILELPYYIFNYDLSRFGQFTLTKFKYFEMINDYHHYSDSSKINEYRLFISIFNEIENGSLKISQSSMTKALKKLIKYPVRLLRITKEKFNVWDNYYSDTNKENIEVFRDIVDLMHSRIPQAELKILVMPFNPVFRWSHRNSINARKADFYNSLLSGIEVIDEFDYFNQCNLFDDHCHLNKKGGNIYSKHLDDII